MIAIVDVHYGSCLARAACIIASGWTTRDAEEICLSEIEEVRPYVPGRFFERELPCIIDVLEKVKSQFTTIVIDGYVHLDENGALGLGGHIFEHYGGRYAVVGVAKTAFGEHPLARLVLRGQSKRPLFVSAKGIDLEDAVELVSSMHGTYRLPTLLKKVDQLTRGLNQICPVFGIV